MEQMRKLARTIFWTGLAMTACAVIGCTNIPPPTPLTELNPQQLHGHDVFDTHCAGCHHDRSNDPLNGPSLRGIFKKQYLPSGAPADDDRVMAAILYGRAMMPPMGSTMSPDERTDLMAYLHTL